MTNSAALAIAATLALTACSTQARPEHQDLAFADCGSRVVLTTDAAVARRSQLDVSCATLRVPLDHSTPKGATLAVQVVRLRHHDQNARIGSLVLNPGGPGESGLDYIATWAGTLPDEILRRFDVVSFDPRGTGGSAPINCGTLPEDDAPSLFPDLLSAAGYRVAMAAQQHLADACLATLGSRAPYFNTQQTAADLEQLRAALGDPRLSYVGFSYGAKLGAEYARQFPDKVRALVLDAPGDPRTSALTAAERQFAGFESSFAAYAHACPARPTCADLGDPRRYVANLVAEAQATPIPSGRRQDTLPANGADVLAGVIALLYDDALWPHLDESLLEAERGDSGSLFEAQAVHFADDGTNDPAKVDVAHANYVINCNDTAPGPAEAEIRASARRLAAANPVFGRYSSWSLIGCKHWQADRHVLTPPAAPTAARVLVVGTVHDPATPYPGAVAMTEALGNATLLTWEGEGHTAYLQSACVNQRVDAYLLSLAVPPEGTRCPA